MPWRSVWPGALFFALVTSAGNYIFPLYLTNVSDLHRIGGTIGFILIALVWFYADQPGAAGRRRDQLAAPRERRHGSLAAGGLAATRPLHLGAEGEARSDLCGAAARGRDLMAKPSAVPLVAAISGEAGYPYRSPTTSRSFGRLWVA